MNGLEISREYYEKFGKPMLEAGFSDILPFLAIGAVGSGSEHYGYDDEVSRDHDFEPGFCIFLPGEDVVSRKQAFQLERAYAKLPKEYAGVVRQRISPVGGNRNGVIRTAEFYLKAIGSEDGELTTEQWLRLPDYALAEAVNGEIFFDPYGEFSAVRERLICMPEDIKRKRIAGNLLIMAQAGQYNFSRCMKHGEPEAAQLACTEFVNAAMKVSFLLQDRYMPYYKWCFRALRELIGTEETAEKLAFLLFGDNRDEAVVRKKSNTIEEIAAEIADELQNRGFTADRDLEKLAYAVNDRIADNEIRNMNILIAVGE